MARRVLWVFEALLVTGSLVAAAVGSRENDWQPLGLLIFLATLGAAFELMTIERRNLRLSASFVPLVLAMVLLGPAPAVIVALTALLADTIKARSPWGSIAANVAAYAAYSVAGAFLARAMDLNHAAATADFAVGVFVVFAATNTLNFLVIAIDRQVNVGLPFMTAVRKMFIPMLPSNCAAAALVAMVAMIYPVLGAAALAALIGVLFLFQALTRGLLLSQERAEALEERSTQLASLQVGVLAALVQTLSLRDRMTARHSAAVARYAKAIAAEIGCSEEEQELVHTAGLLHDIGKFAFPDRILLADRKLDDEDWKIVRTHPYQGARLVRRIDGHGPVADIILAHHERIDGRGYPRGLAGEEIPLLSRMISIADTYDVMTARDSYRRPVARVEAIAELRRVSGAQLDGRLVEAFIRVLEHSGLAFTHTTDADFERELDFEKRVRDYASPARQQLPEAA